MHLQRHQKRFDYNISPLASEELPSFATKQNSLFKKHQENFLNSTSPIKGRTHLNASFDNRYKNSLNNAPGSQYSSFATTKAEQIKETKDRTISTHAYRSRQESRDAQNRRSNIEVNEDKRNNKGLRSYQREDRAKNYYEDSRQSITNNNRTSINTIHILNEKIGTHPSSFNGPLQENVNFANIRAEQAPRPKKIASNDPLIKQVSERELVEKIGRINRLNEQINSRLQRMLSKIDNYD